MVLCEDSEKSWATYNRGKPITPKQLSKRLKEYRISSKQLRIGYGNKKGFERAQFEDVFARYLTLQNSAPLASETSKQNIGNPVLTGFSAVSVCSPRIETSETRNANVSIEPMCFETTNSHETQKPAPVLGCNDVSVRIPPAVETIGTELDQEVF